LVAASAVPAKITQASEIFAQKLQFRGMNASLVTETRATQCP
jgi:hypothetical protein